MKIDGVEKSREEKRREEGTDIRREGGRSEIREEAATVGTKNRIKETSKWRER